jgi:glutaconate CoA-transferase, subunit A
VSHRAQRVRSLEEAAAIVRDGMVVGLSGFSYQNPPMAIVRAIIRRGVRDLTVVSGPTSGLETDLLIGAGCVKLVVTAGVAFEGVVAIAPAFRWGAERGGLAVWECDECVWHLALKAAAWGMPHLLWRGGVGSSLPELNPDLQEVTEGGRRYIKVPPVRPDVVYLHAAEADPYGNVRTAREAHLGRTYAERSLVAACRGPVVATVEKIVTNEEVAASPERTFVRGACVVLAPWGAHPGGLSGRYVPDLPCYREYVEAGESRRRGDASAYRRYLDEHVFEPGTHQEYVQALDARRLERLAMERA